jgi:hypothetical protein
VAGEGAGTDDISAGVTHPALPSARECCQTRVMSLTLIDEWTVEQEEMSDEQTRHGCALFPDRGPIGSALRIGNRSVGSLTAPASSYLHHCPRTAEVRGSSPRRSTTRGVLV